MARLGPVLPDGGRVTISAVVAEGEEEVEVTNIGPTGMTTGFDETDESKARRIRQLERNVQVSPMEGTATLTLTFATVTDRDYWIEQNAAVLNAENHDPGEVD